MLKSAYNQATLLERSANARTQHHPRIRNRFLVLKVLFVPIVSVFFAVSTCCRQGLNSEPESSVQFEKLIRPILERYCIDCHSKGEMKDLDFLGAKTPPDVDGLRDAYAAVWTQIENRTMPPRDSKQPTDTERKMVADWIKKTLDLKPVDFDRISQYVVAICEDAKGNLWFGTASDGAARYDAACAFRYQTTSSSQMYRRSL